jgi:hypothetical protein
MRAQRSAKPAVRCGRGKSRSQGSKRQAAQLTGGTRKRRLARRCVQLASSVQAGWGRAVRGGADGAGRDGAASVSERATTGVCRLTNRSAPRTSSHQRAMRAASVSRKSAHPRSAVAGLTPYSIPVHVHVRKPQVAPTARSILPGKVVIRCQALWEGRRTGSVGICNERRARRRPPTVSCR